MGAIYLTFMLDININILIKISIRNNTNRFIHFRGGYAKYEKIQQIYSILDNTKGNDIEKCNELGTDVAVLELFRRLHP